MPGYTRRVSSPYLSPQSVRSSYNRTLRIDAAFRHGLGTLSSSRGERLRHVEREGVACARGHERHYVEVIEQGNPGGAELQQVQPYPLADRNVRSKRGERRHAGRVATQAGLYENGNR